jgi:hypothetical protein
MSEKFNLYILILLLTVSSAYSKDTHKLAKEANKLYNNAMYDDALKLCVQILSDPGEDATTLGDKASASWISSWVYKFYKDYEKAHYFIDQTEQYYQKISDKYPEMKDYLTGTLEQVRKEKADLPASSITANSSASQVITTNNNNEPKANAVEDKTSTDKTVTLTVVGQGKTIDEARRIALRSAIEQAFGAFISAKTTILNDNLIKDEIVTVSNGNIQKYDVLNESTLPDGTSVSILKAVVSVNKLTSFCESKGISVEFNGGIFAMNIAMQELNTKNELVAWDNTNKIITELLNKCYDYNISYEEPKIYDINNNLYQIPVRIDVILNSNFYQAMDLLLNFVKSISLNQEENYNYNKIGKETYPVIFDNNSVGYINSSDKVYYLRNKIIRKKIYNIPYIIIARSIESIRVSNSLSNFSLFDLTKNKYPTSVKIQCKLEPVYALYNIDTDIFEEEENGGSDDNAYLVNYPPNPNVSRDNEDVYFLIDDNHAWDFNILFSKFNLQTKQIFLTTTNSFWTIGKGYDGTPLKFNFYKGIEKKFIVISYYDIQPIDDLKEIKEYKIEPNNFDLFDIIFTDDIAPDYKVPKPKKDNETNPTAK